MMALLLLKSKIKNFYEQYYQIVRRVIKFVLMFCSFMVVTNRLDFDPVLGNLWFLLLLAIFCGVTPDVVSITVTFVLICAEVWQVSLLLAVIFMLILLIYFLLFGRIEKEHGILVFAIPILFSIHLGYVVPFVVALFASPMLVPAMLMGLVLHFMMLGVSEFVLASARMTEGIDAFSGIRYILDYVVKNKEIIVVMVAFIVTYICVFLIRKMKAKNAMQISILVGTIALMAVMLLSNIILDLNLEIWTLTCECLIAMVLAYIIQFFYISLDYHGTRKLQFEDDEYYYYVTAVPKMKVAVVDKTVTRIVSEEEDENFDLKQELEKALEEDI